MAKAFRTIGSAAVVLLALTSCSGGTNTGASRPPATPSSTPLSTPSSTPTTATSAVTTPTVVPPATPATKTTRYGGKPGQGTAGAH
jgi:hypothetical protein